MAALHQELGECSLESRGTKRKFEDTTMTTEEDIEIGQNNRALPQEMLERVFSHLAPPDLKTAALICKNWNEAAERPTLWSWVKIRVGDLLIRSLSQLRLKRLDGVREIVVKDPPLYDWDSRQPLLQAILEHPGLRKIRLAAEAFPNAEAGLITQVFAKMEEVELSRDKWGNITKHLVDAVLRGRNNLKKLVLTETILESPDHTSLVTALNKIEVLEVRLTEEQANLLFEMMEAGTAIKSLSLLNHLKLSELKPRYLFAVFDKLEVLRLTTREGTALPNLDLVTNLCETVASGRNLKKLLLCGLNLSQVSHRLLGGMVTQLEELDLGGSSVNDCMRDQIGPIVNAIATTGAGTLKKLNLRYIDVSLVDAQSLGRMATQVEELQVTADLSEDQAKAIFGAVANGPKNLRELTVRPTSVISSILVKVDADVLARAANSLECFETDDISITFNQIHKILTKALEGTSLKSLSLVFSTGTDVTTSNLIREVIEEASKIIPAINIEISWSSSNLF